MSKRKEKERERERRRGKESCGATLSVLVPHTDRGLSCCCNGSDVLPETVHVLGRHPASQRERHHSKSTAKIIIIIIIIWRCCCCVHVLVSGKAGQAGATAATPPPQDKTLCGGALGWSGDPHTKTAQQYGGGCRGEGGGGPIPQGPQKGGLESPAGVPGRPPSRQVQGCKIAL